MVPKGQISFPLFQGIRLGVGSEKLALSCMVVPLWLQRTTLRCVPEGFEIVADFGEQRPLLDFGNAITATRMDPQQTLHPKSAPLF